MKWQVGVKLGLLIAVYGICLYSFFQKFVFAPNTTLATTIQVDYSSCRPFDDALRRCTSPENCELREKTVNECRNEMKKAFQEINSKCTSYISKLNTCRRSNPIFCTVQKENVEGCLNNILREHLQKFISNQK